MYLDAYFFYYIYIYLYIYVLSVGFFFQKQKYIYIYLFIYFVKTLQRYNVNIFRILPSFCVFVQIILFFLLFVVFITCGRSGVILSLSAMVLFSTLLLTIFCTARHSDKRAIAPVTSMYSSSTFIYHRNQSNVGKYTIHGRYGKQSRQP